MGVKLELNSEIGGISNKAPSHKVDGVRECNNNRDAADFDPTSIDEKSKVYSRPQLRHLGYLSTLTMGMSGAGIDSVARREF